MSKTFINAGLDARWSDALAKATGLPRPPFSPAVRVTGSLVFTSGQTYPFIDERDPLPASEVALAEQTRACLANIERIITAAGGQRTDIAAVTIYNTRLAEQDIVNAIYSEFFGEHRPARTHVEVSRLADPHLLIEISAIAAL